MAAFAVAVLVLGTLNAMLVAVLVYRRVRIAHKVRRRARLEQGLKPLALAFLDGDRELPSDLSEAQQEVLADVLGRYGRWLRGPATARIAAYFEAHGTVDREVKALATDRAGWRRAGAAYRLGDIGSPSATAALLEALDDSDREVRTAAARSLGKLRSPEAVQPLLAAVAARRVPTALAGWSLLQIGRDALPRLRAALDGENPVHRAGAVRMLGLLGESGDADLVQARLRDTAALVRTTAARSLARLGGPRNVPPLVAALDDRIPAVRAAAAEALGRLREPVLDPLVHMARDDSFEVSRAAAYAAAAVDLNGAAEAAHATHAIHLQEAVDMGRLA
jgi:HEAT repeat protein